MLVKIGVAHAHVATVAALILCIHATAVLAAKFATAAADFASIYVMEACSAVIAEMLVVFIIHHAKPLAAIGITLAAVKADLANFALIYCAKRSSAIKADMVVPIGAFNTVLTALAALALRLCLTAFLAGATLVAEFKAVIVNASLAFLARQAALLAVLGAIFLACAVCVIAVAALRAMHTAFKLLTALATAAIIT